jgi:antitoxin component of MazEF toxin-antitoxin module
VVISTVRKNGGSIVVTISREELERVGARIGDLVDVQIRPVDVTPRLTPDLEDVFKIEMVHGRETLEYLGRH